MVGIINVNKPSGVSSNGVVVKIKKILNTSKIGHLGTLDPLASGVLPICVGKATRLFDYFLNKTKTYKAIFKFGTLTTTLDNEGEIVLQNGSVPTKNDLLKALESLRGEISQFPPKHSAKFVGGVRAYELARKGVDFELKPKQVTIYKFDLIRQIDQDSYEFDIMCSAGTYIRSLCRDLAEQTGTVATMTNLIRTSCGSFNLKDSVDYQDLSKEIIVSNLVTVEQALCDMPKFDMSDNLFTRLINGLATTIKHEDGEFLAMCKNEAVGIVSIQQGKIKIKTYLKEWYYDKVWSIRKLPMVLRRRQQK